MYPDRHLAFRVVNPPVIVGFVLAGVVLYLTLGAVLFLIVGAIAAFAIGLIVYVVSVLAKGPISRYMAGRAERRKLEDELAVERARAYLRQGLEQLACDGRPREASLSALSRDRRTVWLRFQDAKSRVCRPFAR